MSVTLSYKSRNLKLHQLILNIASVNMPKIKPETKCWSSRMSSPSLLLKLQTSLMSLNGRWRGFASATKRLAKSMTDTGRADCARQLLETTACWSASQLQEEWTPAAPVSSKTVCRILASNGLHGRIAAQKPALNKRQLRNHVAYTKAHSLTEGWTAENLIFQMNRQLSSIPSTANIVDDPQRSVWTHGSPRRFGGGRIIVWGYIQYGGARDDWSVSSLVTCRQLAWLAPYLFFMPVVLERRS